MSVYPLRRDAESAPFFDATAQGTLLIRRSLSTGEYLPPAAQAGSDGAADVEWVEAKGHGRIVSLAVTHRKPDAEGDTHPVVVAIVELDEGPWLHAQIVRTTAGEVSSGDQVVVEFEQPDGGEAIPVFAPA